MPKRPTLLKELLRRRHWQTYSTFCRRYDDVAHDVDETLIGHWPSRGQFARWLGGDVKGLPHPDHCRVLEGMFPGHSAAELLAPVPDGAQASPTPAHGSSPAPATSTTAAVVPHDAPAASPRTYGSPEVPDIRPLSETAVPEARRLHEEIVMATQESARFTRRARGAVDLETLEQLDADVRQLATDYLTGPPILLFSPVARLRHDVFELLDQRQRPKLLPELYGIAGKLCALLAHIGSDLGHGYAAGTHTRTAWLCADLADDDPLRAYVRWVQSNIAFWAGDYQRAAEIARAGRAHATSGSSLLRLASQEARAWAACNDRTEVEQALRVAVEARDRDLQDAQPGVFRFDRGKAAYYASEVRLALGGRENQELAASEAQEAIQLFELEPEERRCPEFVAAARLDLANAHLAMNDLDGAAEQLRTVLKLPVEKRTQPIVGRVESAAARLAEPEFTRTALAQDLTEEITLFRTYTATRDLPEVLA